MTVGRPRVVAIVTHPIQYYVPLFRALAARSDLDFEVAYLELLDATAQGSGFGRAFAWDVPLREGYRSRVLTDGVDAQRGFRSKRLRDPRGVLRSLHADAIVLFGWQCLPMIQLLFAARATGVAVMMRGDSNALRRRSALTRFVHRRLFARVDRFLVVGRHNRDLYLGSDVDRSRLVDAPHCVDNEFFAARAADTSPTSARERFGVPRDATCVLFAGKLEAKKHPEHLLEALRRVRASDRALDLHALVVGAGELEPTLREQARAASLPVSFAGFLNQTEIPAAYASADAIVLPSDEGETWGLVVNEAMACGVPAIVSDRVGCAPDLVTDDITGMTYPFGDIDALAERLAALAWDAPRRRAMGAAGRELVHGHFGIERVGDVIAATARELVGSRSPALPLAAGQR